MSDSGAPGLWGKEEGSRRGGRRGRKTLSDSYVSVHTRTRSLGEAPPQVFAQLQAGACHSQRQRVVTVVPSNKIRASGAQRAGQHFVQKENTLTCTGAGGTALAEKEQRREETWVLQARKPTALVGPASYIIGARAHCLQIQLRQGRLALALASRRCTGLAGPRKRWDGGHWRACRRAARHALTRLCCTPLHAQPQPLRRERQILVPPQVLFLQQFRGRASLGRYSATVEPFPSYRATLTKSAGCPLKCPYQQPRTR